MTKKEMQELIEEIKSVRDEMLGCDEKNADGVVEKIPGWLETVKSETTKSTEESEKLLKEFNEAKKDIFGYENEDGFEGNTDGWLETAKSETAKNTEESERLLKEFNAAKKDIFGYENEYGIEGNTDGWLETAKSETAKNTEESERLLKEFNEARKEMFGYKTTPGIEGDEIQNVAGWIETAKLSIETRTNDFVENADEIDKRKARVDEISEILEALLSEFQTAKNDILGYYEKNDKDEKKKILGWLEKTKQEFTELLAEINKLEESVKNDLKSASTSIKLSKVFEEKTEEYKDKEEKYTKYFFGTAIVGILYASAFAAFYIQNKTGFSYLFLNIPIIGFIIWLLKFVGNRRAEYKKLEESFKHKEVMARTFTGYKEFIKTLDSDEELLKRHMSNLLTAIDMDSSTYLNVHGEGEGNSFKNVFYRGKSSDEDK